MPRAAAQTTDPASGVETSQSPTPQARRTAPVPTEAASLAAIERRLGQLVRAARLGLALAAAWLLWEVFGGGIAWAVSAATWAAGTLVLIAVVLVAAMYLSPRFRRALATGLRRMISRMWRSVSRR